MTAGIRGEIERYLRTGDTAPYAVAWRGDFLERHETSASWSRTAWNLANLYLASIGAELLGERARPLVGLSEGTTCFVSTEYFDADAPFSDFVVHEAAHVFHNCKRRAAGLPATTRREWLLDIEYEKREVFAYSCEAYAWIVEHSRSPSERVALAEQYENCAEVADERADSCAPRALLAASPRRLVNARLLPTGAPGR